MLLLVLVRVLMLFKRLFDIIENDLANYTVLVVAPNQRLAETLYRYAIGATARLYRELRRNRIKISTPPPHVPGHVLDKVVFSIQDDMYRALFCLMRITGARIEEIVLLGRENNKR
ncbi:MAG: hypothetical protein B6U73_00485 [Desulfurococcales archaeon ex4484_204]|nr:MAG: hypothetical protein B6U73_00485 [Desulfurococcales archaeon ex4484_204]